MVLRQTASLHATGRGSQVYLPTDLTQDSQMPLTVPGEVIVQVIPHEAVVLLPSSVDLPDAYPIKLRLAEPTRTTTNHSRGERP